LSIYKKYYYLKYKAPTTSSKRFQRKLNIKQSVKTDLNKRFIQKKQRSSGHNNLGHISVWSRGGGHRRMIRVIDYKSNVNAFHKLVHIEYDMIRTCLIGLFLSTRGTLSYRLLPLNFKLGYVIKTLNYYFLKHNYYLNKKVMKNYYLDETELSRGDCLPLHYYPNGSILHNLELYPLMGGQLIRAAGMKAKLLARLENQYALIKLGTKEMRFIHSSCKATLGYVSNYWSHTTRLGKAGLNKWINVRPSVRGTAMNPVDHPHGGGQGKSKGGNQPVTPWGILTKGPKTRRLKIKFIKFTRRYVPNPSKNAK
jgi:large subunit ribosomal protein L2